MHVYIYILENSTIYFYLYTHIVYRCTSVSFSIVNTLTLGVSNMLTLAVSSMSLYKHVFLYIL